MEAQQAAAERSADEALRGHRPHLDGLRAVAVYLVVVFHAGSQKVEGGFIGVDVFFVLSGFLVTRVILTSRDSGSFKLGSFYARRVRRLLPAAVVAIIGIAWLWSVIATPAEVLSISDGFTAALLYFANWFFISESTDYFATDLEASPVLHFWSLSIEEQFYFIWPLVLLGLLKVKGRFRSGDRIIKLGVGAVAACSLVWALYVSGDDLNRAYYGTDTRAYQLLAGALLAMSPLLFQKFRGHDRAASAVSVLLLGALVLMATSLVDIGPIWRGAWTTVIVVGLLIALETGGGPVKGWLSTTPMTYLGQISYGTYLWHWPIVLIALQYLDLSARNSAIFTAVAATGVAALSSKLIELPIRDSVALGRFPRPVIASGLAVSVVAALVVAPYLVDPDRVSGKNRPTTAAQPSTQASPSPEPQPDAVPVARVSADDVDWQAASEDKSRRISCEPGAADECIVVNGSGPHITLVGDSHAIMLVDAFVAIAEANDLTLSFAVEWGCAWIRDLNYQHVSQEKNDECDATRSEWYDELIVELDPDVIVTSIRSPDDPGRPVPVVGIDGKDPSQIGQFAGDLVAANVEQLVDDGRHVVLLEPVPVTRGVNNPIDCLSGATFVDECAFDAAAASVLEMRYRELAAGSDAVDSIDYDLLACPSLPRCDAVVDGTVVRWDDTHLTKTFAISIADDLAALLADPLGL